MMKNIWSQYIQITEELYTSRALRFHDGNKALWLEALGLAQDVRDSMRVLEIGCAGGLFCHRIKTYLPGCDVTGLDFDAGHIAFAREKTRALGLDCTFMEGDATALPFADDSFDLCYSFTVAEHVPQEPFLREQRRVLRLGGRCVVMSVRTKLGLRPVNNFFFEGGDEEQALQAKAWVACAPFEQAQAVGAYEMADAEYPKNLEQYGFSQVNAHYFTVVNYAPDNADVPDETALAQINCNRLHCLACVDKGLRVNSAALSPAEAARLRQLINERFDQRVEIYQRGEKLWDIATSTVLAASGIKTNQKEVFP